MPTQQCECVCENDGKIIQTLANGLTALHAQCYDIKSISFNNGTVGSVELISYSFRTLNFILRRFCLN